MTSVDLLFPPTFFIILFSLLIPSLLPYFRPFSFLQTLLPQTPTSWLQPSLMPRSSFTLELISEQRKPPFFPLPAQAKSWAQCRYELTSELPDILVSHIHSTAQTTRLTSPGTHQIRARSRRLAVFVRKRSPVGCDCTKMAVLLHGAPISSRLSILLSSWSK